MKKDTKLNNQQKQENKSSEKSNEKNEVTKQKRDRHKKIVCEKNPGHVILHVRMNELNFELPPERIAKCS